MKLEQQSEAELRIEVDWNTSVLQGPYGDDRIGSSTRSLLLCNEAYTNELTTWHD